MMPAIPDATRRFMSISPLCQPDCTNLMLSASATVCAGRPPKASCKTVAAHVAFARVVTNLARLRRSHHLAHTRRVRTDILGQSLAGNDVRLMVQIRQRAYRNNEIAVHDAAPSTTDQLFHFFIRVTLYKKIRLRNRAENPQRNRRGANHRTENTLPSRIPLSFPGR